MNLGGRMWYLSEKNQLNVGEDQDQGADPGIIFLSLSLTLRYEGYL